MNYWNDKVADAANLRLFVPGDDWRAFKDKMNAEGERTEEPETQRSIEGGLLNVLNATNVVVLTGTGSSFAAVNSAEKLTPAGMWDVWQAVQAEVGAAEFKEVCDNFTKMNGCLGQLRLSESQVQGDTGGAKRRQNSTTKNLLRPTDSNSVSMINNTREKKISLWFHRHG